MFHFSKTMNPCSSRPEFGLAPSMAVCGRVYTDREMVASDLGTPTFPHVQTVRLRLRDGAPGLKESRAVSAPQAPHP